MRERPTGDPPDIRVEGPAQVDALELTVVIPAYQEAGGIAALVEAVVEELERLGIPHEIRVLDDGSTDGTWQALEALAERRPTVCPRRHDNRGHGPTVVRGYREATGRWVLQLDGDGDVSPASLALLWERRHEADMVLGRRIGRADDATRRLVSAVARRSVRVLFGSRVRDVNTPFRLMRRERLVELLGELGGDVFAPNLLLTGLAARRGLRVVEVPVPYRDRRWGRSSLRSWSLWRGAARAFADTLALARRAGRPG